MAYAKKIHLQKALMWVALGVIMGSFIKDDYSPKNLIKKFKKK